MRNGSTRVWIALALLASGAWGWSACGSRADPQALFAEAEGLRERYEEAASVEAVVKYREAGAAWEAVGNRHDAARAARGAGQSHWQLGALPDALADYEAARAMVRGASDPLLESEILAALGTARAFATDSAEAAHAARAECQQALDLARQAGGRRQEGEALACLGEAAYWGQELERALDLFGQAAAVFEATGDTHGLAKTALVEGDVHTHLSQLDEARAAFERARSLWTSLGDPYHLAIALAADARLDAKRGEYQDALEKFEAALARLEIAGDVIWQGACLTGLAMVYLDLAEPAPAIKHWERAFEIFDAAGIRNTAVDVLISAASTYLAAGDDESALSRFERARAMSRDMGIARWEAFALRGIGVVYLMRAMPDEALGYLEQSLELQRSVGGLRLEAQTRADLGDTHVLLGQPSTATRYFEEALALSRRTSQRVTEANALYGLARTALAGRDPARAREHIEQALSVAESLRTEVESRELRASYVASVYRYHELHVDVLMQLDRTRPRSGLAARAFGATERARARSLLESLAESGVDLRTGVDADLLARERLAKKAFEDWAGRARALETSSDRQREAARLDTEYGDLEERYDRIQAEIRNRSPRYAALVRPEPLGLADVQKQVLDSATVLLEYALGDERSYVWAVSNTGYASYELPPRADIERAASRVYERLTPPNADRGTGTQAAWTGQAEAEYWREAGALADMILAPVARAIAGKRILVVADGMLQYVPFAALPAPGGDGGPRPLLVDHEVVNLPSASVLAVLRRESTGRARPTREVAVLADPVFEPDDPRLRVRGRSASRTPRRQDGREPPVVPRSVGILRDGTWSVPRLASTRREAQTIVASAPNGMALSLMDFDATRAAAMSATLADYRIVHFATHGVLDNDNPGLSGLIFSLFDAEGQAQDGFLRLHDIYGLRLPADLVVLSACDTALGRPVRGEGLMGMVRGFFYAGAARVVASLWKVDDEATGELMSRFYVAMLKDGRSPAAALRDAQRSLFEDAHWRAPQHWAAFVIQGEWR